MNTYVVDFDRIGRCHEVPPVTVEADDIDSLAETVWRHARRFLGSAWFEVDVDLETGTVWIENGRFGRGVVRLTESDPE